MASPTETKEANVTHGKYGRLLLGENGIIYFYLNNDFSVDLATAKQAVAGVASLDNSGLARLLIVMGHNIDLDFAAQRYFGSSVGVTKLALIVQSKMQIEVANFLKSMLKLFNASYQMKPFHTIEEGEKWLLDD